MLIGHDLAWEQWRDAMTGNRMHHAWLLTGRRGLGKMSFALTAARQLVGADGEGEHPDILVLSHLPKDEKEERKRDEGKPFEVKRNISIGQIRAMQQRLITRPTMGDRRAIIIDPADDLERNASNALLKSLEEPPAGTYFLLVAHQPARLLPTIRSRCRVLRFPELPNARIAALLDTQAPGIDGPTRDAAIAAAAGSPGAALAFVQMDLGEIAVLMRQILETGDGDFGLRGRLASAIGVRPDRVRLQAVLDLARSELAERVTKMPGDPRPLVNAHSELVQLGGEAASYNYDPGLMGMEIGTLLARAAPASERTNV